MGARWGRPSCLVRLLASRLPPRLSCCLIRRGLGDGRLPLDGSDVGCGHGRDIALPGVVDGLNLKGVNEQSQPTHLLLGGVKHLDRQGLTVTDDVLDGHGTDDRAEVTGEDLPYEVGHLTLVCQESLPRVDDRRPFRPTLQRPTTPTLL